MKGSTIAFIVLIAVLLAVIIGAIVWKFAFPSSFNNIICNCSSGGNGNGNGSGPCTGVSLKLSELTYPASIYVEKNVIDQINGLEITANGLERSGTVLLKSFAKDIENATINNKEMLFSDQNSKALFIVVPKTGSAINNGVFTYNRPDNLKIATNGSIRYLNEDGTTLWDSKSTEDTVNGKNLVGIHYFPGQTMLENTTHYLVFQNDMNIISYNKSNNTSPFSSGAVIGIQNKEKTYATFEEIDGVYHLLLIELIDGKETVRYDKGLSNYPAFDSNGAL